MVSLRLGLRAWARRGCAALLPLAFACAAVPPPDDPLPPPAPVEPDTATVPETAWTEPEPAAAERAPDPSNFRVTDSGLGIEDLVVGPGAEASAGQTLVVHYVGTLGSGTRFDSSRDRGVPLGFSLGSGQMIPAWEEGLVGMRVGGLRRLVVPPHLAYGARGQPPAIPPDAILEFEIELLEVR